MFCGVVEVTNCGLVGSRQCFSAHPVGGWCTLAMLVKA